ncbi:hypothetical protein BMF94_2530 [Rhodotorula taiwanensis]|uniref:mRNA cap guanine-N(7) methyltransferase n=1 Tax=Rhodotorula taiwanensis TaxID=741276 RepID=A0A2S5BC28_9BASI|nr:hypothetical protein BMF94_2530 [Rhodotorula taiwanensis]
MSLQSLLDGGNETLRPAVRPYAPTKRRTPAASVLTPISRVELVQCQVSANPLNPRSSTATLQSAAPGRAPLPPPPAGLPARPDSALASAPSYALAGDSGSVPRGVSGAGYTQKRPRRDLDESAENARKRWKEGDVRTVADHYNARPNTDREARVDSPIIGLKRFNNWIKSVLIGRFGRREGDATPLIKVLDLGCGKGGDLQKWSKAGTGGYVGIDIATVSVEQARSRWEGIRFNRFPAEFYALDCFESSIDEVLPPATIERPFDVVSMQFCMHYAFETEEKVRTMLANVARHLKPGGVFIGTIPDAKNLFEHLDAADPDNPLVFGNSVYSVKFDSRECDSIYGHRYTFYLQDAVEEVPEYVVYWDPFVELAQEYGLELRFHADFQTVFAEEQGDPYFSNLLRRMKVMDAEGNAEMDEDQLDAAMLYLGFAFVKTAV